MFKEWATLAQDLAKKRTKENVEKAEKLKKKYRIIGRILKIIGLIMTIASVGSFITFSIIGNENYIPIVIISGLLFPISFGVFGFGGAPARQPSYMNKRSVRRPVMPAVPIMPIRSHYPMRVPMP